MWNVSLELLIVEGCCIATLDAIVLDVLHEVEATKETCAIRWQRLLTARVGGCNSLTIVQVVLLVYTVDEEDAGFCPVPCRAQDVIPECHCADSLVDLTLEHQVKVCVILNCLHKFISHSDTHVELCKISAVVLGSNECLNVWVVHSQYAHLSAAPVTCRSYGLTHSIKDAHERHWSTRAAIKAPNQSTVGTQGAEVIPYTATKLHGSCRLCCCIHYAAHAVLNRRRHKAIIWRNSARGTHSTLDTACWQECHVVEDVTEGLEVLLIVFKCISDTGHCFLEALAN